MRGEVVFKLLTFIYMFTNQHPLKIDNIFDTPHSCLRLQIIICAVFQLVCLIGFTSSYLTLIHWIAIMYQVIMNDLLTDTDD